MNSNKAVLLLFLLWGIANAKSSSQYDVILKVNSAKTTWVAGHNFFGEDPKNFKNLMGVIDFSNDKKTPMKWVDMRKAKDVPQEFDSRKQWPNCPSISEIRDQSMCGSCWAFGAVEAMSDRICIHSETKVKAHLSADNLLSCCKSCGMGCNGGYPAAAWRYWEEVGIVTGGNYDSDKGCQPYPFPICSHHVASKDFKNCSKKIEPTPRCQRTCTNTNYTTPYADDLYMGKSHYRVSSDVLSIQTEILDNGPVEAAMTVYEDFITYKSGVYQHVTGEILGGHAIRMLGWGVENGTDYWLMANSWNNEWGDHGFFKILRGVDECGIESSIAAGLPKYN